MSYLYVKYYLEKYQNMQFWKVPKPMFLLPVFVCLELLFLFSLPVFVIVFFTVNTFVFWILGDATNRSLST